MPELTFPTMGTVARIAWTGAADPSDLIRALAARMEQDLSRFIPGSEVSALTRAKPGQWTPISRHTWDVLSAATTIRRATDGVFHPVLPVDYTPEIVWSEDLEPGSVTALSADDLCPGADLDSGIDLCPGTDLNPGIDLRPSIDLDQRGGEFFARVEPPLAGAWRVDLGGIGKGYLADQIASLLVDSGCGEICVNLGCSSITVDASHPLRIGVASPWRELSAPLGVLTISTKASISVSADTVSLGSFNRSRACDEHGLPARTDLAQVLVVAREAIDDHSPGLCAEGFSTAFLAMGFDRARLIDAQFPQIACIFFTTDGQIFADPSLALRLYRSAAAFLKRSRSR